MFILDEIACAVESVGMFVEEKVNTLRDSSTWGSSDDIVTERDVEEDDFDRYLRDCATGVLFPCGVPESIKKEREEEKRKAEEAAKPEEKET